MRLVLFSMLLVLVSPRAEACPDGTMCTAIRTTTRVTETAGSEIPSRSTQTPRSMLQLAVQRVEHPGRLATSLRTHVVPRARAIEMPWIWKVLRQSVYAQLPRYVRATRRPESRFSFVVAPVVVESPQDTVPGVGVEGGF